MSWFNIVKISKPLTKDEAQKCFKDEWGIEVTKRTLDDNKPTYYITHNPTKLKTLVIMHSSMKDKDAICSVLRQDVRTQMKNEAIKAQKKKLNKVPLPLFNYRDDEMVAHYITEMGINEEEEGKITVTLKQEGWGKDTTLIPKIWGVKTEMPATLQPNDTFFSMIFNEDSRFFNDFLKQVKKLKVKE